MAGCWRWIVLCSRSLVKVQTLCSVSFLTLLGILYLLHKLPVTVLWMYGGLSALAFLLYAKDKVAAKNGRWRTPEITLHTLALLGGWPGAGLAQIALRHKVSKPTFQGVFWVTVILNCVGLYLFTTQLWV